MVICKNLSERARKKGFLKPGRFIGVQCGANMHGVHFADYYCCNRYGKNKSWINGVWWKDGKGVYDSKGIFNNKAERYRDILRQLSCSGCRDC